MTGGSPRRVDAAMLALVVIWGVNFPLVKGAFAALPPFAFNGLRFAIAAALLAGVVGAAEGPWWPTRADLPGLLGLGLVGHAAYQMLWMTGLARTTAGHSSIILAMVPLFVGVLGALLRIERSARAVWLGLVVAFAGVVVLVTGGAGLTLDASTAVGDTITLAAAVCWAAYTVISRRYLARFSPLRLTTVTLVLGLPVILAAAVPELSRVAWAAVPASAWAALAFSSLFAVVLSYVIWYTSVQTVGGARTAAYSNLIPIVALLSSRVLLGEPLGVVQVVGTAIVLTGVWLARRPPSGV